MEIRNASGCSVIMTVGCSKIILKKGEKAYVEYTDGLVLKFEHNYHSYALSEKEIANDDTDMSILSLLTLSHKPPYFTLVLDSAYSINTTDQAVITIHREKMRSEYTCAYDRFYPQISEGSVKDISHTFKEREEFEQRYKNATSGGFKKVFKIFLIVISAVELVFSCFLMLVNFIFGLVTLILSAIATAIIAIAVKFFVSLYFKASNKMVFKNFENEKIIKDYCMAKKENNFEKYGLIID